MERQTRVLLEDEEVYRKARGYFSFFLPLLSIIMVNEVVW